VGRPPNKEKATRVRAKKTAARKEPDKSLSFDTLSRLGREFGIPVLAGISASEVSAIPENTIFASVSEQHWLLCLKGAHAVLVFDSLGLPISSLNAICKGITIEPWNRYGYQSMFGSVCGYYVVAALIFIQHGHTLHNGDLDTLFMEICRSHARRPKTMSSWYTYHRHHDAALRDNDQHITDFVLSVCPHLGWIDRHSSSLGVHENHSGLVGSPIYKRAGIHAPTVHQKFSQLNNILRMDGQKSWPGGIGEQTIATAPEKLQVVDGRAIAYETAASKIGTDERIRRSEKPTAKRYLHTAGPNPNRRLTPSEKVLWARAALNAFDAPSGISAAGNQQAVAPDGVAENLNVQ